MGLVSQLVMRSFDVSDKGEVKKEGRGPSGKESQEDSRPTAAKAEEKPIK